ncbi:MAG: ferritin family protein [Planctomycetes bacterium]|nr:ferritin family protein [Planctomycetota bacterium]
MAGDLTEAIQLARKMELDGIGFYDDAAKKAGNPQAAQLFKSFSKDEERHLKIVSKVAEGMGVDVDQMPMPADEIKTVFSTAGQEIAVEAEVSASEREAIEMALEMEEKSYKLYADAAKNAGTADQRAIFERLSQEENQHYSILENTREYLDENEQWNLSEEWGLLMGDLTSLGG